jgi:glycogen(starch) synthase
MEKSDYFYEVSWEVCNKVGGIYTVVRSKVRQMMKYYKDRYFVVGPYSDRTEKSGEFIREEPPANIKGIADKLSQRGIAIHYGKWIVNELEPIAILVDTRNFSYNNNTVKKELWDFFKIDSLATNFHDFDEPILWSYAVGIMLEEIMATLPGKTAVAQFHEWLAGGGLLYLSKNKSKIGTVFTTHATMLGRTLATGGEELYDIMDKINPEQKAYQYGIQSKFLTERACAHSADVFTTVSEITGIEATYFLGKKPDVLLPNGLDIERFPTFEDASIKHKMYKDKIMRFCLYYFFPYYSFDIENTLYFFLCGRNEFKDKGIDVYIEALGALNRRLKDNNINKNVVAFIWVPADIGQARADLIENRTYYEDIFESIQDIKEDINHKMVLGILSSANITPEYLLGKALVQETKQRLLRFKRKGLPPLCTHNINNEPNDRVMNALKNNNLLNDVNDKVKVIFYPLFLTGADGLMDLGYYEAIIGCHLGVFPSYYEPWGYTPLETGALGVASVTTDLAGFGKHIEKESRGKKNPGIFVLERLHRSYEEIVSELTDIFFEFTNYSKQDRIENKLRAKRLASMADWDILADNYIKAHNLALDRAMHR